MKFDKQVFSQQMAVFILSSMEGALVFSRLYTDMRCLDVDKRDSFLIFKFIFFGQKETIRSLFVGFIDQYIKDVLCGHKLWLFFVSYFGYSIILPKINFLCKLFIEN